METKANYVAVGAFVLACVLGLVIALLWLAGAQYSQEFAYYQTYFSGAVTGLSDGTAVRYNGIDVGRVSKINFDPNDPKKVIVTMQINPDLKLHEDSVASIASEGLTGGSYVEIDGGKKDSPILTRQEGQQYPVIKSEPSTLQQLAQSAPALVAKLNKVGDKLNDLLNDENRKAFSQTLSNLRDTTAVFDRHSADLDRTLTNLKMASADLDEDLTELKGTLGHADTAIDKIGKFSSDADNVVKGDTGAQLSQLVTQTRALVTSLKHLSDELEHQPTKLIFGDRREGYTPK
ncbi:MAG TPA: MlaD family protein [Rhizomicrobium sp.]|nr:MlaD family protein [Rhizomicrobium sp.]